MRKTRRQAEESLPSGQNRTTNMLKNYLKIALRNLLRNRTFSVINILGLGIGITGCLIILLYVGHEFSFDRFNKNYNRIYRVGTALYSSGKRTAFATASDKLGPALEENFPEVEEYVRTFNIGEFSRQLVRYRENAFYTRKLTFADSSFFQIFNYHLLEGNPSAVLSAPFSVVLTKATAIKYFGDLDPVGKIMQLAEGDTTFDLKVAGIAADPPSNSSLQFDSLVSFRTLYSPWWREHWAIGMWGALDFDTYVELAKIHSAKSLEAKLPSLIESQPLWKRDMGDTKCPLSSSVSRTSTFFQIVTLIIRPVLKFSRFISFRPSLSSFCLSRA